MAKRKYPSELNSRTVRVNIGDWQMLLELARQHDTTVAKILHLAITGQAKQEQVVTPRTQIPMPVTTATQAIPTTVLRAIPTTTIATNGNKAVAFRIKSKGVKRYD
ncbi:unnamed protein product [marine sediment metagenome]|uniref:Uncharacterized protein n=1 Tax=marine sediment metagenome TaxID=412755 RepID=X1J7E8_9ZZZZ